MEVVKLWTCRQRGKGSGKSIPLVGSKGRSIHDVIKDIIEDVIEDVVEEVIEDVMAHREQGCWRWKTSNDVLVESP